MSDRRSSHRHHPRPTFEEKCRALENELKRKNETLDESRNDYVTAHQPNDLTRTSYSATDPSFLHNNSRRSSGTSNWSALTKDREIAKLKALVFEKDSEIISLASSHKNALVQVEDRMERERKAWNDHKDLLLAGERAKFEEEKTRLFKDLQQQLNLQRERCEQLEKQLHEAQMQMSEAKLVLKESARERINAIYAVKEQCRKEFQEEIARLRNQFQMEKNAEFARVQERVRELEETLDQVATENADHAVHEHELFFKLEASEKTCVRTIIDTIKKLLMAMDSPSPLFATIPNVSSFTYDRDSIIERLPTRSVLKLLQDSVDDIRNYVMEQRVQNETKVKMLKKSKQSTERSEESSNGAFFEQHSRHSHSKHRKENGDRSSQSRDHRSQNSSRHPLQLSTEQNDTIDNLVEKLENHIANELDRLTKQRMNLNSSSPPDERSTSQHYEPPKKVKFESKPSTIDDEINQDSLIRHLQNRISDLRDDNRRLRGDQRPSKSLLSSYYENDSQHSITSNRSRHHPKTQ